MAEDTSEVSFKIYEIDQLFVVPETPGIYVWFMRFQLPTVFPAAGSIEDQVLSRMSDLRGFLRPEEMTLSSSSAYGVEWRGTIAMEEDVREVNRQLLGGDDIVRTHISHLNAFFGSILPVLYVGKADNLQRRLSNHIGRLRVFDEFPFDDDDIEAREFAERAASRGLDPAYLRFTFFEYPECDPNIHRNVRFDSNEVAEHHINRTIRPILGKR